MAAPGKDSSNNTIDQLMLQEILWRREEANSALSNLYLRGTVLTALAISVLGLIASSTVSLEVRLFFAVVLSAVAILGLITFWPHKKQKYKLATIETTLKENETQASRFYMEFVEKDFSQIEIAITRKTSLIKIGFIICIASVPAQAILMIGVQ